MRREHRVSVRQSRFISPRKVLFVATATLVVVAAASVAAVVKSEQETSLSYRGTPAPRGFRLPAFSLRSYRGGKVTSSDLRGKVVVLAFLDSKCRDACPLVASVVAKAVERLGVDRPRVTSLALSVNPNADTPSHVRRFLAARRASGRIDYLLGNLAVLRPLWHRFQILSSFESGNDDTHSDGVRIYDRSGTWVSTLRPGLDLTQANLLHDMRLALTLG
jgi:cytochrome oxidase Cu insertion factor (SCO1/SenC/PrrC family)